MTRALWLSRSFLSTAHRKKVSGRDQPRLRAATAAQDLSRGCDPEGEHPRSAALLPLCRDSGTGLFPFSRAAVAAHDLCLLRVPGVLPSVAPPAKSLCRCRGTSSGPANTLLRVAVLRPTQRYLKFDASSTHLPMQV